MEQVVIIPGYNPTARLVFVVASLCREGFKRFIIVDDGSDSEHQAPFEALEARGAVVLRHPQNLGKGMAIKTALARLRHLYPEAQAYVTVDADGQHLASDVARVCAKAQSHPGEMAIGTRCLDGAQVPLRSRLGNRFSSAFFKMDTGMTCPDTQTGLRCVPVSLLPFAQGVSGARYDYEMNMLTQAVKRGVRVNMVPIETVYEDNNAGSHFRAVRDSLLIYRQPLAFAASSAACAALDLALFALILAFVGSSVAFPVAVATVVARLCSGCVNFALNRTVSFRSDGSTRRQAQGQAARYAVLFACIMGASALGTSLLAAAGVFAVLGKVVVDSCLFLVSFFAQRNWVFAERQGKGEQSGHAYAGEEPLPQHRANARISKGGGHASSQRISSRHINAW